jgi:hypothetical protein
MNQSNALACTMRNMIVIVLLTREKGTLLHDLPRSGHMQQEQGKRNYLSGSVTPSEFFLCQSQYKYDIRDS